MLHKLQRDIEINTKRSEPFLLCFACFVPTEHSGEHGPLLEVLSAALGINQGNLTVNGGGGDGGTVQCKGKWPSASARCTSMFTVPSALLCFDNLSSQNSPRKSYLVGLHKCMYTHTHTMSYEWRKRIPETTIRGTESDQRTSKGCNHCGTPQTGWQRKPRHGSEL